MSVARRAHQPVRESASRVPRAGVWRALGLSVPLLAAAVATFAYRDTLTYFFSQDAFTVLARVRGLEKMPGIGWRWLSGDLYFRLGDHLFGLDPRPYRAVALGLHAINAGLVAILARRLGLGAAAALFGAAFFASHYAHFDALYSVAGAGELLAATFAMLALIVALPGERGAQARWRAPVVLLCYVVALSSKENVLLLPALIWLANRMRPSSARIAIIPTAILGALYVARFMMMNPFGAWGAGAEANAYRMNLGSTLLETWSTYLAWSLGLFDTRWGHLVNELGREPLGLWFMVGLALLLLLLWRRRRALGAAGGPAFQAAIFGTAGYAAFILPVLPLSGHTTHQYLYLPIGLLGLALAAGLEAWVPAAVTALLALFGGVVRCGDDPEHRAGAAPGQLASSPGNGAPRGGRAARVP